MRFNEIGCILENEKINLSLKIIFYQKTLVNKSITSETPNSEIKTGYEKIIDFFNNSLEANHPIAIAEVVERTGFSWSFVKKTLKRLKDEEYYGFHFEKSGSTWIAWKDREHIIRKMNDTCGRFLEDD